MHVTRFEVCPYCTVTRIVVNRRDELLYVYHALTCPRGQGHREFVFDADRPLRINREMPVSVG